MNGSNTADWNDVLRIRKMIKEGCNRTAINFECSALSHVKYYDMNKTGHELRQKYRRWLKFQAWKPFRKRELVK